MNLLILKKGVSIKMLKNIAAPELIVVVILLLLFFGGKKLPEFFKGVGGAISEFKKGTNEKDK